MVKFQALVGKDKPININTVAELLDCELEGKLLGSDLDIVSNVSIYNFLRKNLFFISTAMT